MSTKPTDTGRWAVDGSDVDATNIIVPTSGQRDVGYGIDSVPTSGGFNYLENIAYRWRKYLSDGALEGDHSIDGNLAVDGDLTVSGTITAAHHDTTSRFVPRWWITYGGPATATAVPDPGSNLSPVWQLSTTVTVLDTFSTSLDFLPGDKIAGVTVDLYGNGGGPTETYDLIVNYYPTAGTAVGSVVQIAHISAIAAASSWSTKTLTIDAPSQVLGATGVLNLMVKIHGDGTAGTRFCYIGNVSTQMVK